MRHSDGPYVDVLILLLTSPWGPRASIRVPADERPRHPRNIPMAFVIAAPCIDHLDQACIAVCPVDCISHDPAADRKAYIDPEGCIECGACESACP